MERKQQNFVNKYLFISFGQKNKYKPHLNYVHKLLITQISFGQKWVKTNKSIVDRYLPISFGQNDKHKPHLVLNMNSIHYSDSKSALTRRWTGITKFCSHTFTNQLWLEWWMYAPLNQCYFLCSGNFIENDPCAFQHNFL